MQARCASRGKFPRDAQRDKHKQRSKKKTSNEATRSKSRGKRHTSTIINIEELLSKSASRKETKRRLSLMRWRGEQNRRLGQRWLADHGASRSEARRQTDVRCVPRAAAMRDANVRGALA